MEAGKSKLESLGIPPITPGETPEAYAEFFRAARKLRSLGLKTIALIPADDRVAIPPVAIQLALALSHAEQFGSLGAVNLVIFIPASLIPADDRVAIPPVAIQLALALSHAADQTVNVLDANTRHPALSQLASKLEERTQRRGFITTWIADRVTVTTPPGRLAGLNLVELEETLDRDRQRYGYVLIDFTGFEKLGEHVRAFQIVDGVLIVARTGKTKERDLLARSAEVPDEKNLGVLLIG